MQVTKPIELTRADELILEASQEQDDAIVDCEEFEDRFVYFFESGAVGTVNRNSGAVEIAREAACLLTKTQRIAQLNDLARTAMGIASTVYQTPGINALPLEDRSRIRELVETFDAFTPGNNPYGERDFGNFEYKEHRIYWKIDYYDPRFEKGSESPEDPSQTKRVLTIMLAEEY